jgi:hypothetical protein
MEFYSDTKNEILTFAGEWIEQQSIILKEVRPRRPKILCSPSYAYYRPKTIAVILLYMGPTLRGEHTWMDREGERNQKLECGWCAHSIGTNIVILNGQRPLWEGE